MRSAAASLRRGRLGEASMIFALLAGCGDERGSSADSAASTDSAAPVACASWTTQRVAGWEKDALPARDELQGGRPGVALGDLNKDGWPDALLAWPGGSAVLLNDGAGQLLLTDVATVDGAPLPPARAAALADLDGDGDLDGYLGFEEGEDLILWN